MDEYEKVVNTLNASANFTLETCSLSEQLDNVISKHLSYIHALEKSFVFLFINFQKFIDYQAAEGTGLAFIVFTQAIVELPGASFWSCIFFLMLLALGLGSQIGILEGMLCVIFDIDLFKRIKKQYMTGTIIVIYLRDRIKMINHHFHFQGSFVRSASLLV